MKPPSRPRKRQRTSIANEDLCTPDWTNAISSLVERLDTIHSRFANVREGHLRLIADIDERMQVHDTASRVASKVSIRPSVDEASSHTQRVHFESKAESLKDEPRVPSSPLTLLLESEPPEKALREQSIIARAQAINRKNSELARERLPKQPEPMRNKTVHDYFLDEAAWLATDFIGERKWKMQMARKIAKMVVQYHNQQRRREARAEYEEKQRIRKLATSIAKDVSRFWKQIGEIAEYRAALKTKAQEDKKRRTKLRDLLQKTAAFSSELASTLQFHSTGNERNDTHDGARHETSGEGHVRDQGADIAEGIPLHRDGLQGGSMSNYSPVPAHGASSTWKVDEVMSDDVVSESSDPRSDYGQGQTEAVDDEITMAMAEAEEEKDPDEILNLQSQANLPLEELLRLQGVDPEEYLSSKDPVKSSEGNESDSDASEALTWDESVDDEETIQAAELEDTPDVHEGQKLAEEAASGIEDILRAQGIDPDVYRADQATYLKPQIEKVDSTPSVSKAFRGLPKNDVKLNSRSGVEHQRNVERKKSPNQQVLASPSEKPRNLKASIEAMGETKICESMNGELKNSTDESNIAHQDSHLTTESNCIGSKSNGTSEKKKLSSSRDPVEKRSQPIMNGEEQRVGNVLRHKSTRLPKELLRGNLRDYQKRGLDWLLTLWRKNLNGILADEMGLGKTIQTIALLAWLAVEKNIWGPHLIVVPTSVMVNWEVEFKKWLPGFKVLTYFGSVKERKEKRRGWTRPDMFHVCITSYTLAVQDSLILRRKKWYYLILDEAHNIKNFESQRWQTLLTFSSRHRLLLTGTPLQNSVMELWSLMHFLMPNLFESHSWFKDTFWKPLIEAVEAEKESNRGRSETVTTLHGVLRPFLLRRLKADVEKGLPPKTEHVIPCRLSKRQRQLYEDFMARNDTRETLQSGDFFGVMNVLMQLRKVCNHPDLFEGRPILSPFSCNAIFYPIPTIVARAIQEDIRHSVTLRLLGLSFQFGESISAGSWYEDEIIRISAVKVMRRELEDERTNEESRNSHGSVPSGPGSQRALSRKAAFRRATLHHQILIHALRVRQRALLGQDLRSAFTMSTSSLCRMMRTNTCTESFSEKPRMCLVRSVEELAERANPIAHRFVCCITRAVAPCVELRFYGDDMVRRERRDQFNRFTRKTSGLGTLFREFEVRSQVTIPDTRLIQWDCGKLQTLERLIRELKARKSRALIFTQMTRMLDILESFLNLHCCRYLRLDGTTKTDDRQKVVERFNADARIFCMILTTRAGGVGLNLTGADTVIFYDSDYNPAIDNQAQDRAHRIGQTRPVHVYRLISEQTVEESILKRAMQKRSLEQQIISEAGFTTDGMQRLRRLRETGASTERTQSEDGRTLLASFENTGTVKNGLRSTTETPRDKSTRLNSENGKNESNLENAKLASQNDVVQCSYGEFTGFRADNVQANPFNRRRLEGESTENGSDKDLNEYHAVASKLLAREDEREGMALQAAEKEKRDLEAEFKDSSVEDQTRNQRKIDSRSNDTRDLTKLLDALTPIQRYALRVLERSNCPDPIRIESTDAMPHSTFIQENVSTFERNPSIEVSKKSDSVSTGEDDTETLLYEVDVTDEGQTNYLKALTDADADINLYLPLRDGGPEELKFSTVVHGTAAAGLECAEDAAFFPHAYNRMSRTMHATRRQKEKGLENLRKRKAEVEVKRKHEVSSSASNQASNSKTHPPDTCRGDSKRLNHLERNKVSKLKTDTSRNSTSNVPSKKIKIGSGPKSGNNVAVANSGSGPESHQNMGLFRNKPKKNTRRITIPGMKSSIAFYGSNLSSEHQGVNDEWTKEEDEALITAASACNNNMFFVSELLSSQAAVRIGARRFRPIMHCVDRLLNVLGKDIKNGPLLPKSTSSDMDIQRKYQQAFQSALAMPQMKPLISGDNGQPPPELHPSHQKLLSEAASKMKNTVRPELLPPVSEVLDLFEVPEHHKPGFKTHEIVRQGHFKRKPFMFPPRDELRPRAGLPGTVGRNHVDHGASTLKNVEQHVKATDQALGQKTASKGIRNQIAGTSTCLGVQSRTPGLSRNSSIPKPKTGDLKNRSQAHPLRTQPAGNLPPPHSALARKASASSHVFVTGYHHAQQGSSAQKYSSSVQNNVFGHKGTPGNPSKNGAATSALHTGSKLSHPGRTSNASSVPRGVGKVSNGSLGKSSAVIVQSMGSASVPQNRDRHLYYVGSHAVLPANVEKIGSGRGGDRPKPAQIAGTAPSRESGMLNTTRVDAMASKTGTARSYAVQGTPSVAVGRETSTAKRGTTVPNGNLGLVRRMLRGGVSKTSNRGAYAGRTATLGRGGLATRIIMSQNLTPSGRGNTVMRGSVSRGASIVRGRGVAGENVLPRVGTSPQVGATQTGSTTLKRSAAASGAGAVRAVSIGRRGVGVVDHVGAGGKAPRGRGTAVSGIARGIDTSQRIQTSQSCSNVLQTPKTSVSVAGSAPVLHKSSVAEGKSENTKAVSDNGSKATNTFAESSGMSKK